MDSPFYQKLSLFAKMGSVVLFFMVLFSPLLGSVFQIKNTVSLNEKRNLAQFPTVPLDLKSIGQFAKAFEHYYDDNFTFRDSLIFFGNYIKTRYLSSSPNPKVIIGKEDWLFYRGDNISNITEGYSLYSPLTGEQLMRLQSYLEAKRNWLARRGTRYLLVIAPDKQTVYPEFLPSDYFRAGDPLDQLVDHLRAKSDLDVLDLRETLRRAKSGYPVYYKTDTHWNEYGSFLACNEIIERLRAHFPGMRPLSPADYEIRMHEESNGDLATMLAMGDLMREEAPRMTRVIPNRAHSVELDYEAAGAVRIDRVPFFASECAADKTGGLPRAVLFGDSFSTYLVPYLAESFPRAVFLHIWDSGYAAQKAVIEHEKPGVVIDEVVERLLKSLLDKPIEQVAARE